jgi:hypothetical protein
MIPGCRDTFFSDELLNVRETFNLWNQATVELGHFADQVFAKAMFPVILRGSRRDLLLGEIAGKLFHLREFFRQTQSP